MPGVLIGVVTTLLNLISQQWTCDEIECLAKSKDVLLWGRCLYLFIQHKKNLFNDKA
jgi:hypothetical protein